MRGFGIYFLSSLFLACVGGEENLSSSSEIQLPQLPEILSERPVNRGAVRDVREFQIALTGELRGEIQPCGCPTLPYGGFARRAVYLDQLRAEPGPLFQLDAGETLLKGVSQHGREDALGRANIIMSMMDDIGVQAMTLGPTDLIAYETLADFKPSRMPLLLHGGWSHPEAGRVPGSGNLVVLEQEGIRIAVVGLSGDSNAAELSRGHARLELVGVAREALKGLNQDVDLVVGLGSLSALEAEAIADAVPEIGLILSTAGSLHQKPRAHGGAVLVESIPRGRYISTLRFWLASNGAQPLLLQGEQVDSFQGLHERRFQARSLGEEGLTQAKTEALFLAEANLLEQSAGLNLLTVEDRPLGTLFDKPSVVDSTLESFLSQLIRQAVSEAQVQRSEPEEEVYGTPSACVNCHVQPFAQWAYTAHKSGTITLAGRGEHKNPECLSCHSTGFGKKGGFGEPTAFNLGRFGGVQCEACHGTLGGHPDDEDIRPVPITEQTCLRCHDEANSPDFNYPDYLRRIRCDRGQ